MAHATPVPPRPDVVVEDHVQAPPNENPHTGRQLKGAAVAGAAAGLVVGGPLLAAVAAGGAVYAATAKGNGGDIARNMGDGVADVGVRLKRFNRKHQISNKTAKGLSKASDWAVNRMKPKPSSSTTS